MGDSPTDVREALARVVAQLPGGGEERPGQLQMAEAVAEAIEDGHHLLVQAGTGTGKSLAYLLPSVLMRVRCVVATATKALQEQLVTNDLPFLHRALGSDFTWALLKGRSNYLCRAALADVVGGVDQGALFDGPELERERVAEVVAWTATTSSGDRADLPFSVANADWARLSVGVGECPGAHRCPHGDICFAEDARQRAAEADVVVVNTHLYGTHLASGGVVLPDHDVVVVDEAHALEDIAAATLGTTLSAGRFTQLARSCRALFTPDHAVAVAAAKALEAAADGLARVLAPLTGQRVQPAEGDVAVVLLTATEAVAAAAGAARGIDPGGDAVSRKERLLQLATSLSDDLHAVAELDDARVAWVEDASERVGTDGRSVSLRVAPIDVGAELALQLFAQATVVLTSATLVVGGTFEPVARRLGLDRAPPEDDVEEATPRWRGLDVGSPFDYPRQALLYCAAHLPDPRTDAYPAAMLNELEGLIRAAGGRTLALFTSRRAMEAAEAHLAPLLPWQVLVQDALPRPLLHEAFLAEETSVLLATMSFWQGFDAPGRTCSLVVVDRLPFSRPNDPLAQARRTAATRAKRNAFASVDLPRAAVLLAQGAGRLIRSVEDRGVVAVLDRRLATASYRWDLIRSLPPMRRTKDQAEVRRVLAELAAGEG
ncbi:MAG: ATP-dependent DNA helicase [Acidimicrobiales bacterium]